MEGELYTIVNKREWEFKKKDAMGDETGEVRRGVSYIAFGEDNRPIKFQSQNYDHKIYKGLRKFDRNKSERLVITMDIFGTDIKYREEEEIEE